MNFCSTYRKTFEEKNRLFLSTYVNGEKWRILSIERGGVTKISVKNHGGLITIFLAPLLAFARAISYRCKNLFANKVTRGKTWLKCTKAGVSLIRFPARTKNRGSLKSFPRELDKSYRRRFRDQIHFLSS